jgi:hypothetical protein
MTAAFNIRGASFTAALQYPRRFINRGASITAALQ